MQSNNQFPLLEILGLLNSNFALQVDISAEYNYQYDLILIKKQKQHPLVKEFLKNWKDLYEYQSKPVAGFGK